jgi:hypothetical protein
MVTKIRGKAGGGGCLTEVVGRRGSATGQAGKDICRALVGGGGAKEGEEGEWRGIHRLENLVASGGREGKKRRTEADDKVGEEEEDDGREREVGGPPPSVTYCDSITKVMSGCTHIKVPSSAFSQLFE